MKLSADAVDQILHVIATFDRERGIPHDYFDLEIVLRNTNFVLNAGQLEIQVAPQKAPAASGAKPATGKEGLLHAARAWRG